MARKPEDNSPQGNAARASIAAQQRANRRKHRGNALPADWESADGTLVCQCITRVTAAGHAIQFGYTTDGGSFVVRIVGDGDPYNDYIRPSEDINTYLEALAADYAKG